jgi:hypothetical protein
MYKKWDMDTCTPADYTIQIKISEGQFATYKNLLQGGNAKQIDEIITELLEAEVEKLLEKYVEGCDPKQASQVASITFGYKNGDLIRELQNRGALIGYGQFHKVDAVDQLINQIIMDDKEKLQQPVYAFVTFNSQHAHKVCEDYLFKFKTIDRKKIKNREYDDHKI